MNKIDRWEPVRPVTVPQTPNPDAVSRGLQNAINTAEVKRLRGRTGVDVLAGFNVTPAHEPVVPGWLYEGTLNSMSAASGVGKSLVCVDLATAVTMGGVWHGIVVEPRQVVVLATEHALSWHQRKRTAEAVYNDGKPLTDWHIVNEREARAACADPEHLMYAFDTLRITNALIIVDTAGAAANLGNTNTADAFAKGLQRSADESDSCVLFTNHEDASGKARGARILHTDISNRFRVGRLPDGTTELSSDRDRYGHGENTAAVRYHLARSADGAEYLARLGPGVLVKTSLSAEILNYVAQSDRPVTGREIMLGMRMRHNVVNPVLEALTAHGEITRTPLGYAVPVDDACISGT